MARRTLGVPEGFSFRRTVLSHGWYALAPFHLDRLDGSHRNGGGARSRWRLGRVMALGRAEGRAASSGSGGSGKSGNPGGPVIAAVLSETLRGSVSVEVPSTLTAPEIDEALRQARVVLRLDEDLSGFAAAAAEVEGYQWIAETGAGRLLRSPTVFEDLVKMICTTNCSWSLTDRMVRSIVEHLGSPATGITSTPRPLRRGGRQARRKPPRSFPSPEVMARAGESFYRDTARAGYRASYLQELAERVASGELDPESWARFDGSADDLKNKIETVKGAGRYASENLLRLLGRHDGLALDSWCRKKFSRMHARGRPVADRRIAAHYRRFGEWRGLAMWCDLTRDWLDDDAVEAS